MSPYQRLGLRKPKRLFYSDIWNMKGFTAIEKKAILFAHLIGASLEEVEQITRREAREIAFGDAAHIAASMIPHIRIPMLFWQFDSAGIAAPVWGLAERFKKKVGVGMLDFSASYGGTINDCPAIVG